MGKIKVDRAAVDLFIFNNIVKHPKDIITYASRHFNVSRQTIYRRINHLINNLEIVCYGEKRNRTYALYVKEERFVFPVGVDGLDEEIIWRDYVKPVLPGLPLNIIDIIHYGIAEIVNNVSEHSEATEMIIVIDISSLHVGFWVIDNGIGIFTKIQMDFNLHNKNHAVLELAKGKLTSDPSRHSGEGIFFTSRMFDEFVILSEDLTFFGHDNDDCLLPGGPRNINGTSVHMRIERSATRTMKEVFDRFTPDIGSEDFGFKKTIVPVKLLQYEGEALVSRSQAKRLISRFDQFREVILDFKGVKIIGQPFADEVFRVFQTEHPETHLQSVNTNEDIDKMINHVLQGKSKK